MQTSGEVPTWDFSSAIDLLKILSTTKSKGDTSSSSSSLVTPELYQHSEPSLVLSQPKDEELSLGNFGRIWEYLTLSRSRGHWTERSSQEEGSSRVSKEVRWRDEVSGADLEDNVDTELDFANPGSLRTRRRAERRARARERTGKAASRKISSHDAIPDSADNTSDEELDRVRRSPDRRAVIQEILYRPSTNLADPLSPPTSPSPPKETSRVLRKDWPISNPFQWSATTNHAGSQRNQVLPLGHLSANKRKSKLIARLAERFPSETKHLKNKSLIHPEFTPLNTSDSGVHVFVDISNVGV
jgi:hypothetical protein